jgi:hypothetical protein
MKKTASQIGDEVLEKLSAFEGETPEEWKAYVEEHNLPRIYALEAALGGLGGAALGTAGGIMAKHPGIGALIGGGVGLAASPLAMRASRKEFDNTSRSQWKSGLKYQQGYKGHHPVRKILE